MTSSYDPEPRHASTVERVYADDAVEVTWQPDYCIHFAACVRGAGGVFDPQRRPWVDLTQASPERIVEVARLCPTGALHARLLPDGPSEDASAPPSVQARRNGPLFVRGHSRITDAEGHLLREDTRIALCRCGGSANKPFCDGTHRSIEFKSEPAS